MILLIDNYDSFTYNLVQRIGELMVANGSDPDTLPVEVVRNDKITPEEAIALEPTHVIVSPGPCTPNEAGVSMQIIEAFAGKAPLMGVCLGHQSIGQQFGMVVERNVRLMHGKTSPIHHDGKGLFVGMSNPFTATRYHSLIVNKESFNSDKFEVTAWTDEGEIMGLRSKADAFEGDAVMEGVQFHPESFMTTEGPILLANFLGLPRPKIESLV
ncbi:MAG: aminodeoxychorismate/anthranilate synthase component II [Planctomycetota bacterium]